MKEWAGNRLVVFAGMGLVAALLMTGCAQLPPTVPEVELQQLLALQWSPGLSRDQSTRLRALLQDSRDYRRTLSLHLDDESNVLSRRLANGEPINSPALLAQIGLVHQLRVEQLTATLLLRERARGLLTGEQRDWVDRNRLNRIFPP